MTVSGAELQVLGQLQTQVSIIQKRLEVLAAVKKKSHFGLLGYDMA